ncbi:MAG: hypothetical protein GY926_08115 [bacterium]|nr:hypothetical protein [bacterium]
MPVIVIGADTTAGQAVVAALRPASGEIRVFVSDDAAGADYRCAAKVAVGDISDGTHVGGAAIGAFCAVVVACAAHDTRDRHFAPTPAAVFAQWADGLHDAGIGRVIVIGDRTEIPIPDPLAAIGAEYVVVGSGGLPVAEVAGRVAAAEAALPPD